MVKNDLYLMDRAQKKWRKAVTGDAEKSVREHMKEIPQVDGNSFCNFGE